LFAKHRWEHWDGSLYKVDAGSTFAGITVQSSVRLDEVGYIGYMDTHVICTVIVDFDRQRIIEIFSVFRIERNSPLITKVLAAFDFVLGNTENRHGYAICKERKGHSHPWNRRNALEYIVRELFRREIAVFEESAGFNLDVTNRSKLFDKCTKGMQRADRLND